jgi:hypothetical protein
METNDTGATPDDSEGSLLAQFIARLTKYLEDGKKAGKHLQQDRFADSVKALISKEYMPKPQGTARNKIILLVAQQLPDFSTQSGTCCGDGRATVHRVLKGDDTGGGNRGHGGARK